ncbi:hypothetical protein J2X76_005608 [Neorhizobium sp. 2083]|uniref:DUF1403 family protein n=1 Tax=Neorhizobium sp. 2083 TaxID=2817762 RepID=UPI00285BA99C|nr:DUF1403 family protein [Neorhizobium sp. 2083]MDR6820411.1 hypothetical protein [Neorhizobium sp. 2083]
MSDERGEKGAASDRASPAARPRSRLCRRYGAETPSTICSAPTRHGSIAGDRLALKSAVMAAKMLGRGEEETAIPDPGPAGKLFLATRMLARQSGPITRPFVQKLAEDDAPSLRALLKEWNIDDDLWDEHFAQERREEDEKDAKLLAVLTRADAPIQPPPNSLGAIDIEDSIRF